MIYTIGKKDIYLSALAEQGTLQKLGKGMLNGKPYPGGSVWKTYDEALEAAKRNPGFMVFGVDADWDNDTEPATRFHNLLKNADIIVL